MEIKSSETLTFTDPAWEGYFLPSKSKRDSRGELLLRELEETRGVTSVEITEDTITVVIEVSGDDVTEIRAYIIEKIENGQFWFENPYDRNQTLEGWKRYRRGSGARSTPIVYNVL